MEARRQAVSRASCSFYTTLTTLFVLLWIVAYGARYGVPSVRNLKSTIASYNIYTPLGSSPSHVVPAALNSVDDLIAAIQKAAAAAAGGRALAEEAAALGKRERAEWHNNNPCRSRSELQGMYDRRKFARDVSPNSRWETVMDEYAKLHRTCLRLVRNSTEYFLNRSSSTGCKFVILDTPKVGLGNKLLLKASVLLFAVLTQRVLLIPSDNQNGLEQLCEPFVGSSWKLEKDSAIQNYAHLWQSTGAFQKWVDRNEIRSERSPRTPDQFFAANLIDPYQPMVRFYCNTEQAYLSKVTWISIGGCVYFLPKLFAIPAFRPALEQLFPDRMVLTHIMRSMLLPADHVWERIRNVEDVYLDTSHKRVGVQLRFFGLQSQYKHKNDIVNEHVLQCGNENGFLPRVLPPRVSSSRYPQNAEKPRNITKVLIASLFPGLHDYLSPIYLQQMTETGEGVGVVQLTSENEQHFGSEVDVQAFVEIMCLSFSDFLVVTPWSTFGGVAQAYGALKPWFVNYDSDGPACDRAQTVDVCFDQARDDFLCPHDPELHGKSLLSHVPYIKRCLRNDADGVQLITDHESNAPLIPTK
ncbi:xyloglucan fucosyltransferase [Marchantia polymorpha subsp. ruderalis]|uniref:Fucosyltransferase n=1 Tax=Marchantia polymorpha TaxID=3197 RepID=A0A2R6W2B3_MARPO|nr:hypothetical protein MARPO_0177s0004 [Marchantia polymorpha]BBN02801.1 hypothetical protein Mp_2g18250 [Marchantia polymorpha subsp. ruderalis]|eukprot:PTQ27987.1 hypothetical protein MARPO_0177s0004 [Marchantia polymorpha]